MTDKPIPAKILLHLIDIKSKGEDFIGLSAALYKRNLIFSEPRELRRIDNILKLTVIFRDIFSFKNWRENAEIKKNWTKKFDTLLAGEPKTIKERDVIIEVDNVKNCICRQSDFYILQGRSLQFIDELTCSNCMGQISYAKIPQEIELEDWQTKHQRVYLNWIESGLFEKESIEELTNYKKGKLNLEGEKIRSQLSLFFKIPVYINYFVEESGIYDQCLICGGKGVTSGIQRYNWICKNCNTIFG